MRRDWPGSPIARLRRVVVLPGADRRRSALADESSDARWLLLFRAAGALGQRRSAETLRSAGLRARPRVEAKLMWCCAADCAAQ